MPLVHGMPWWRHPRWDEVAELEMELDGKKIAQYRATTKIYFDIEK
jgi:flavin-binding protein dodecin